jgi:hypothetical protein
MRRRVRIAVKVLSLAGRCAARSSESFKGNFKSVRKYRRAELSDEGLKKTLMNY